MVRIYTIQDVAEWLMKGKDNGLSETVISKPRAWAFLNNPYASPSMPAVAALFEEGEVKGYAAVFPERFEGIDPTIFWGSTFYVDASMRGKGCGVKILSLLQGELDGIYVTTQTPISSSAIFKKLGALETWFPEYWVELQRMNPSRGNYSLLKKELNHVYASVFQKRRKINRWYDSFHYQLEYCSFVDEETYAFIRQNRSNDVMLRSQAMLNWMLHYPFLQNAVLDNKVRTNLNYFSCQKRDFKQYAVRVMDEMGGLVGFYVFKYSEGEVNLLYLYYTSEYREMVFASFCDHLLKMEAVRLRTTNSELVSFIKQNAIPFISLRTTRLNLCAPKALLVSETATIQGGEGDMFVI